jgi:hypothetical protein
MTKIERMNYEIELWAYFLASGGDPTIAAGSCLTEVWE